jgi:hypothetical protein
MRRLKESFPEMSGALMWGSARHETECSNTTLAFILHANELMRQLRPGTATIVRQRIVAGPG